MKPGILYCSPYNRAHRLRVLGESEDGGPCGYPAGWIPDRSDEVTAAYLDREALLEERNDLARQLLAMRQEIDELRTKHDNLQTEPESFTRLVRLGDELKSWLSTTKEQT